MVCVGELLQAPYWVIDILPEQVPAQGPGQYFAVDDYVLREQLDAIKQRHVNVVLKLNCYLDVVLEGQQNPLSAAIARAMRERSVYIMVGDAMILSESDDTHLTLFNPDERLLALATAIAAGEGLFVWQP